MAEIQTRSAWSWLWMFAAGRFGERWTGEPFEKMSPVNNITNPRDPGSPSENGSMEPKYYA